MTSMSTVTTVTPKVTPDYGGAQSAEAGAGLDQLFAQVMQQLQALIEQTEESLDGSMLPPDGESLPLEGLGELEGFSEHLQGELTNPDQDQMAALVRQLTAEGVSPEQVSQLGQAALLLQDAQRQAANETQSLVPNPGSSLESSSVDTLLQLAQQIRAGSDADQEQTATETALTAVDELLRLADKLRNQASMVSAAEDSQLAESSSAENDDSFDAQVRPLGSEVSVTGPVIDRASVAPFASFRAEVSEGRRNPAGASLQAGSGIDDGADSVSADAERDLADTGVRRDRSDSLREQGLARWVELRDTVLAQGQKLAQSESAIKEALSAQAASLKGEGLALTAGSNSANLMQLQQAYQTAPANTALQGFGQRFGSQGWAPAASQRISWMAGQNISVAEMRLDPPELGSLTVRLTIQGDQTSLSFTSPHAQVREVLEQQMPRLREMLSDSGLELGQADVSDQSQSQGSKDDRRGIAGVLGDEAMVTENQQDGALLPLQKALSLVDYYA